MLGVDWEIAAAVGVLSGAFITALGVIVTSVLNINSNRLTREGLEQEQRIANNAADRSEAAARLTEEYTRRIVDALETMAVEGIGGGASRLLKVRWELVHDTRDRYRLTNVGDLDALEVKLATHVTLRMLNVEGGPNLGPGEALTFMAARHMGTSDSTVTVTWQQENDEDEFAWRYPLPGRPPRR